MRWSKWLHTLLLRHPISFTSLISSMVHMVSQNECMKIPRILDFSTTYHMTSVHTYFTTYNWCFTNWQVFTIDGKLLLMARIDIIHLPPIGHLHNVMHVPLLSTHLIYVSKLRKMISCDLLITLHGYFMYDKVKDQKIELAKEWDGFYYVDIVEESDDSLREESMAYLTRSKEMCLLHQCFRHPSLKI